MVNILDDVALYTHATKQNFNPKIDHLHFTYSLNYVYHFYCTYVINVGYSCVWYSCDII